ncbi:MAG: glycosyltransferase family 39 protein [Terriglobales bacterium]
MEQSENRALVPSRNLTLLILSVITVAGAALRLHGLGARSLWIDEAASVRFATMAWGPFLHTLWNYQGNMSLYYLLLRWWIHLGDSEFMVRGLSVLLGVLTIPAIYLLGARLFDRATGLASAALLSVHSFHIHWSQETRAYTLLVLLLVLATCLLISALESNRSRNWIVFSVAAALSVYAHIFALLVLLAHAFSIVFPRPYRVEMRKAAVAAILFAFLCAPMAAFVLLHHSDQIAWIPQPSWADMSEFLQLLTGQGGIALVVIYFALCGLAFLQPAGEAGPDKTRWGLRLLGLWLVLPPGLTLLAGVIKPLFYGRYMLLCVPALVILAARGLVTLGRLPAVKYWVAAPVLVLVLSLSAWGTQQYYDHFSTETSDWRSAVNYILERQQPGDSIVFYIPNYYAYMYYAHRAESQHVVSGAPDIVYPPSPWRPISRTELMGDISGRKRVWLVLHIEQMDPQKSALVQSTIGEGLQLQEKKMFPGEDLITVELFSQAAGVR